VNNLRTYAPKIYDGVVEMLALLNAETNQITILDTEIQTVKNNQYVSTATEAGVVMFEKILNITADPSAETLDFRKQRVINRFSTVESPTAKSFRNQLDALLGKNNYELGFVYADYELDLTTHIGERGGVDELMKTLIIVVPANMLVVVNNILYGDSANTFYRAQVLDAFMEYTLSADFNLTYSAQATEIIAQAADVSKDYLLSSDVTLIETMQADTKMNSVVDAGTVYEIQ
jgi:hypothetical protein